MKLSQTLTTALALAIIASATAVPSTALADDISLLNVSYDPTREFYEEYNKEFNKFWKAKTGDNVIVNQSHGGGGKQTRAIIEIGRAHV